MRPGKIGAQCGHATLMTIEKATKVMPELVRSWRTTDNYAIHLFETHSETDLDNIYDTANLNHLPTSIVYDAGRTQIAAGSGMNYLIYCAKSYSFSLFEPIRIATVCGVFGTAESVSAVTSDLVPWK